MHVAPCQLYKLKHALRADTHHPILVSLQRFAVGDAPIPGAHVARGRGYADANGVESVVEGRQHDVLHKQREVSSRPTNPAQGFSKNACERAGGWAVDMHTTLTL